MNLLFTPHAWEDYLYWQSADRQMLRRIHELLRDMQRSPFVGLGKPKPLRHMGADFWARRINEEHRLVYAVRGDIIHVLQMRHHY